MDCALKDTSNSAIQCRVDTVTFEMTHAKLRMCLILVALSFIYAVH